MNRSLIRDVVRGWFERKKSAKQLAAQARQEAELSPSIREVYRKLAGYHGCYPIDHAPAMDLSSDTRNQHFGVIAESSQKPTLSQLPLDISVLRKRPFG
jgi:hypothetical protein